MEYIRRWLKPLKTIAIAGLRGSRDNARHARNNVVYNLYVIFACAQKYHRYDVQTTGYTTPMQKFARRQAALSCYTD